MTLKTSVRMAIAVLVLIFGQGSAFADDVVNVTVDTSGLGSIANSEVFFILTGTGNNTATLSNISLAGGTAGAVDLTNTTGGTSTSDSLASSISLNDSANFLTVFAQSSVAGKALSFNLDLTTNVVLPTPDQFTMAIVDPTGNPIQTSDPTGFDNLFAINLDSITPTTNIYSDLVTVAPVPEPSSLLLLASGLSCFGFLRKRSSTASLKRRICQNDQKDDAVT